MDLRSFRGMVEDALASRSCVSAFVHCAVGYSGRAETSLPRGDRILVLKADRSLLVHQPDGSAPVNYMKAGSDVAFDHVDDHLMLHAMNPKEKAWIEIEVFRVHDAIAHKLEDGQRIALSGSERDMSDWIRDNPGCIARDFRPVSREEQTDVGFIDVFGRDGDGLVVVECKRVTASLAAVDQLRRYVERVKSVRGTQAVRGVLAAPAITPNALEMLASRGFSFAHVDPPQRLERWQRDQKSIADY